MYLFARTRDRISRFCVAETEYSMIVTLGTSIDFTPLASWSKQLGTLI